MLELTPVSTLFRTAGFSLLKFIYPLLNCIPLILAGTRIFRAFKLDKNKNTLTFQWKFVTLSLVRGV